jgi:hypothetical protein
MPNIFDGKNKIKKPTKQQLINFIKETRDEIGCKPAVSNLKKNDLLKLANRLGFEKDEEKQLMVYGNKDLIKERDRLQKAYMNASSNKSDDILKNLTKVRKALRLKKDGKTARPKRRPIRIKKEKKPEVKKPEEKKPEEKKEITFKGYTMKEIIEKIQPYNKQIRDTEFEYMRGGYKDNKLLEKIEDLKKEKQKFLTIKKTLSKMRKEAKAKNK